MNIISHIQARGGIILNHENRIQQLESAVGWSSINVLMYICPPVEEDSFTYTGTDKQTKLLGNDETGDGSVDKPFATINRAVRELQRYRAQGTIVYQIYCFPGIYRTGFTGDYSNNTYSFKMIASYLYDHRWRISHPDCTNESRCYIRVRGVSYNPAFHDNISAIDTAEEMTTNDPNNPSYTLQNSVVFYLESRVCNPGGWAPWSMYVPVVFENISFKCNIGLDPAVNQLPNNFGVFQYGGDGASFSHCKFYNFIGTNSASAITIRNGNQNPSMVPLIENCLFDNTEVYNSFGINAMGNGIFGYGSVASTVHVFNCEFRYCGCGISCDGINLSQLDGYEQINNELISHFKYNNLVFKNCFRGILANSGYAAALEQMNTERNINCTFINTDPNVVLDYKIKIAGTSYT